MTLSRPAQDALWLERLQRDGLPQNAEDASLTAALQPGLELLRAGRYWEAHESLEDLWREHPYPLRLFHYALIKIAVGLLHIERRSAPPAERQLTQAALYLEPFTPAFAGLDTLTILAQVRSRLHSLSSASGAALEWDTLEEFAFPDTSDNSVSLK